MNPLYSSVDTPEAVRLFYFVHVLMLSATVAALIGGASNSTYSIANVVHKIRPLSSVVSREVAFVHGVLSRALLNTSLAHIFNGFGPEAMVVSSPHDDGVKPRFTRGRT